MLILMCVMELTEDGDLQLRGSKRRRIGWRSGSSGQGVKSLRLLSTGNLVLTDGTNRIRWQSFEFPTNVILWGQRFNFSTHLTSFTGNSSMFYSVEIQSNKIGLYLNSGKLKYSYWEFRVSGRRNIVSGQLGSTGLKLFDESHKKIGQISTTTSTGEEPIRFLALSDITGNLGLYHYSPDKRKFEASFRALNETCQLPLSCGTYGICTFSDTCTCIQFLEKEHPVEHKCNNVGFQTEFCSSSHEQVEMVEIMGVSSILRGTRQKLNVISKEECLRSCIGDCICVAALYSDNGSSDGERQCFHYGLVTGLKQIQKDGVNLGLSYFVKVGATGGTKGSVVKKWLLLMGGVVDVLIILLVLGGLGYYFFVIRKRRSRNDNAVT